MVDKVKPLGLEVDPEDGALPFPTEFDPTEDYADVKGVAFESSDSLLIDKNASGNLQWTDPTEPTGREFGDVADQADAARFTIVLTHNGTINNGTWYGYSSVIPGDTTPIMVQRDSTLLEIAWSNSNSDADFTLHFKKNSTGAADFLTLAYTDTQYFTHLLVTPEEFNQGDRIYIQHEDDGGNAANVGLLLGLRSEI
jgi:hypothetical protein